MDDLELASGASPEIGRLYRDAKAFRAEAPVLALINLRGLAVAYCACLDRDASDINLSMRIEDLKNSGLVKGREYRHLRRLQGSGNKAAHPEEYEASTLDFPVLAAEAMESALALVEQIHVIRDGHIPIYQIAPVESNALRDMCVRAMLERDVEAMNQAGEFFKERADRQPKIDVPLAQDGYPLTARHDIEQAIFWLKQAADDNFPSALYQYGLYLTQHHKVSKDQFHQGQSYIARSAHLKNADALAYVGNESLEGGGIFVRDEAYARNVFMDAARQGHPYAWSQLGAMNATGRGGAKDLVAAALYTLEAARAGIPQAQFNLSIMYRNGEGLPQSDTEAIKCLQDAAEQDHPGAIYNLACEIEDGKVPDRRPSEAIAEFERVLGSSRYRARAALYAAKLIAGEGSGMSDWMRAAGHLQLCYSCITVDGDGHGLKGDCLSSCKEVVGKIRTHLNDHGPDQSLKGNDLFVSAFFDRNCVPYADIDARREELVDIIYKSGGTDAVAAGNSLAQEACLNLRSLQRGTPLMLGRTSPREVQGQDLKVGRNEICHCGSGRKFKKCHGR